MHNINPKFLNADGTIDTEAAMAAGREARAEAIGAGEAIGATFEAVCEIARELCGAGNRLSNTVNNPAPSQDGARG